MAAHTGLITRSPFGGRSSILPPAMRGSSIGSEQRTHNPSDTGSSPVRAIDPGSSNRQDAGLWSRKWEFDPLAWNCGIAQLAVRLALDQEVVGSIPAPAVGCTTSRIEMYNVSLDAAALCLLQLSHDQYQSTSRETAPMAILPMLSCAKAHAWASGLTAGQRSPKPPVGVRLPSRPLDV